MVSPGSGRVSRVRPYSGTSQAVLTFRIRGYHPVSPHFPESSAMSPLAYVTGPTTPRTKFSVWALPSSLAATLGISFDFSSSAYLDVSVQQVSLP